MLEISSARYAADTPARVLVTLIFFPITSIVFAWWINRQNGVNQDQHHRGAQVFDGAARQKQTRDRRNRQSSRLLTLAGIEVPVEDEPKHFKLVGVTGAGKSTAIAELMRGALARGDQAIFADPDRGYLKRFYDASRGDVILNLFDSDSVRWDLFGEIKQPYDIDDLAKSLIPKGVGIAEEWHGYARTFLAAVITYCHTNHIRDMSELWRLLVVASAADLHPLLADTPAQSYLDEKAGRMFASLRGVCMTSLAAFQYLKRSPSQSNVGSQSTPAPGAPLSVRQWVQNGKGVLWIPYTSSQIASLASIITTWIRLAITETMNRPELPPDQIPPLWLVVDELDALGKIDGLQDVLARLRKFGGRCVLGFQSIAQVSDTYGQKTGDA